MVGRNEESKLLKKIAQADRSQLVVVYGRRRVGKTYLVRETFDYRFSFTHTGMEKGTLEEQLHAFHDSLVEQGLGECERPDNWIDAFGLLKKLLKSCPDERKLVFIDELPWMDTPRSKFVSALENFWNGWCAARKDIVLIVCGSATSWMIKAVLRNKGGLFNRANRVLNLEPFTLAQCEEYMRGRGSAMSRRELTEGYITRLALDKEDAIIGYEFVHLGKMMEMIKKGEDANEALKKATGQYGRFDNAPKYIDPRHE